MTWYVVASKYSSHLDEDDACIWTVSRNPDEEGWETDSGFPGYGLTRVDAQFLADAANEKER